MTDHPMSERMKKILATIADAKAGEIKGVKVSQQTKEKISMAQKGKPKPRNSRPMDDKTKMKISASKRVRRRKK